MKLLLRLLLFLCLVYFGYRAVNAEFEGDYHGVFSFFDHFHLVLLIIFTIAAFIVDFVNFRERRQWYQLAYSFVGIVMCVFIFSKKMNKYSIARADTLFIVKNKSGARYVMQFEFKENNFRMTEYDLFGHTVYYGKYKRENDRLTIISSNYKGTPFPKTGVIRDSLVYWDEFETMQFSLPDK